MKESKITSADITIALMTQVSSLLPIGITICDLKGEVLFKNSVFGTWMPNLHIEMTLWFNQLLSFMSPEHYLIYKDVKPELEVRETGSYKVELEANYLGSKIFYRLSYFPLLNSEQKTEGLIEITENITEVKELDKSLQHARRFETVGRLASGIAHDFNNILQVINGHSEMLLESRKSDAKLARSLEIILSSGQKASALTRQLLLFSRRQKGEFKQINLGTMLTNMQKILSRMLGEDITFTASFDDEGLFFEGDESQVEQVIMNLAINARDAMPAGGKINISISLSEINETTQSRYPYLREGKYINLQFSDTGCGIPADLVEHIFEPFFTTKETGRGTGLGLATVYSIIKQHQGFINVESQPGQGTTFRIFFPVAELQTQVAIAGEDYIPQYGNKKRVLIIEDDDNVKEFTLQALSHYGYKVKCASDIKQALDFVKKERFDLLLIDIVLPDGDGVGFLESLQGDNAKSAFVLSSGYTEDKPQIKNTLLKGYSFLHKPFTIHSLLQTCAEALKNKNSSQ